MTCAFSLAAGQARAAPHAPATAAERALDQILRTADKDDNQLDNLFQGRGDRSFRPSVDYRPMLAAGFLAALSRAQRDVVQADCRGKYLRGYACGLDYSPLTCAQDRLEDFHYETRSDDGSAATIAGPTAVYRLAREAGGWKIDGVLCNDGTRFNMPTAKKGPRSARAPR